MQILGAAQDSSGLLWFISMKGVMTYDSQVWKMYRSGTEYPQIAGFQKKITVDRFNTVWILPERISSSIVSFNGSEFMQIPPLPDKLNASIFTDFIILDDNIDRSILISTQEGHFLKFTEERWQLIVNISDNTQREIVELERSADSVLLFTDKGILTYSLESETIDTLLILPEKLSPVIAADLDDFDGKTCWLLGEDWYGAFDGGEFKVIRKNIDIPFYEAQMFNFIKAVHGDRLFFGNRSRFFLADNQTGRYSECGMYNGYITDGASSVLVDREYNIWITTIRGINKIQQSPFVHYYRQNGLLEDEVTAVEMFDDSTLVFGHNNGLTFFKDGNFETFPFSEDKRINTRVLELRKDSSNRIWMANAQMGIGLLKPDKSMSIFPVADGQLCNSVYYNNNDTVWYGLGSGLYYFLLSNPNKHYKTEIGIFTRKIVPLRGGTLLLCTTNGLYLKKDSIYHHYRAKSHLYNNVFNAFERDDGTLLIASLGGAYRFEPQGKFYYNELPVRNSVFFITQMDNGVVWYGTDNGVVRKKRDDINYFSSTQGLSGNETNRSAGFIDPEGNLWIGTAKGVSVYDQKYDILHEIKPLVQFRAIEFNDNQIKDITLNQEIPYDRNSFILLYSGLSFINEKENRYKILLTEDDMRAVERFEVRNNRFHIFNLQPGDYRFHIKLINSKGIESQWISTGRITILSPFYRTIWFYLGSALLFSALLIGVHRLISGKRYTKKLEAEVEKRTEELQLSQLKLEELNRNLETLVESKTAEITSLIEQAPTGVVIFNKDGTLAGFNKRLIDLFNIDKPGLLQAQYNIINSNYMFDDEYRQKLLDLFQHGGAFRTPAFLLENFETKYSSIITSMWLVARFYSVADSDGNIFRVVGLFEDVTDTINNQEMQRKLAEQKIRSHTFIKATEDERERISRDLHDEFGQFISGAKYYLEAFSLKSDKQSAEIDKALDLLVKSGTELRNIIHDLHPQDIVNFGLLDSIEMFCDNLKEERLFDIDLDNRISELELPDNFELPLYRIFKEAMTNIIKHAQCSKVSVLLNSVNQNFVLSIEDNGKGFILDTKGLYAMKRNSYGLSNMYERAELLGGILSITTKPGEGTKIVLVVPESRKSETDE